MTDSNSGGRHHGRGPGINALGLKPGRHEVPRNSETKSDNTRNELIIVHSTYNSPSLSKVSWTPIVQ